MNIISAAMSAVAAVATAAGIGIAASPTASGDSNPVIQKFGTEETLVNSGVVQGWTVGDLQPSTDAINVSIRGKLWEATATDKAIQGQAMPLPFRFSARTPSGQDYGYVLGVPTPHPSVGTTYPRANQPPANCTSMSPAITPTVWCTGPDRRTCSYG